MEKSNVFLKIILLVNFIIFFVAILSNNSINRLYKPLTYIENKIVDPERLSYKPLTPGTKYTVEKTGLLNNLGSITLYFKHIKINNSEQENISSDEKDLNRFSLNIKVFDENEGNYISDIVYEPYYDKSEIFQYPFGFPSQNYSKDSKYRIEIIYITNDLSETPYMAIAVNKGKPILSLNYHLPFGNYRYNYKDTFMFLLFNLSRFVVDNSLILVLLSINTILILRSTIQGKIRKLSGISFISCFLLYLISLFIYFRSNLLQTIQFSYLGYIFLSMFIFGSLYLSDPEKFKNISLKRRNFFIYFSFVFVISIFLHTSVNSDFILLIKYIFPKWIYQAYVIFDVLTVVSAGIIIYLFNNNNKYKPNGNKMTNFIIKNTPILLAVPVIVFILLTYKRLFYTLLGDELFQFNTAYGFLKTGKFVAWNFINNRILIDYTRSWPSTFIFSIFMSIFGVLPSAARLSTFLSGITVIIYVYFITASLTKSRYYSLLISMFIATNMWFVNYSANIRMYIFIVLLSIIYLHLTYLSYQKGRLKLFYLLLITIIAIVGYLIHPIFLSLIPVSITYFIYQLTKNTQYYKKNKSLIYICLTIFYVLLQNVKFVIFRFVSVIVPSIRNYFNTDEVHYFNDLSFISFFGFSFLVCLILIVFFAFSKKKKSDGEILLLITFFIIHLSYGFIDQRSTLRYISVVIIPNILLLAITLDYILGLISNIKARYILIFVAFMFINLNYGLSFEIPIGDTIIQNNNYYRVVYNLDPKGFAERPDYELVVNKINKTGNKEMVLVGYNIPLMSYYFQNIFDTDINYYEITQIKSFYNIRNIMAADHEISTYELMGIKMQYKHGLIMWTDRKDYHIQQEFRDFVNNNFIKISGDGVDNSYFSVYQW